MLTFVIIVIVFSAVAIIYGIYSATTSSESENVVEPPKEKPRGLTDAELEAIRQADEAFDYDTRLAIIDGSYNGPLPEHNAIEIIHAEGYKHLGYIPAEETQAVRDFLNNQLPYPCRAHISEKNDYDDRTFLVGEINIKRPSVSPK